MANDMHCLSLNDITEILLKVALNTTPPPSLNIYAIKKKSDKLKMPYLVGPLMLD